MGTVHHLSGLDDRPAPARTRSDDSWGDLELPDWDDFTAARERFFAGLRSAAELHRDGEVRADGTREDAPPESPG
jgi:hypothetical protein